MSELFASGRIVQAILALVAVEAVALALVHLRTGRGLPLSSILWNLLAGAALLLALYNALVGAPWPWIATWLAIGFVAHLADLWLRTSA